MPLSPVHVVSHLNDRQLAVHYDLLIRRLRPEAENHRSGLEETKHEGSKRNGEDGFLIRYLP